MKKPRSVARRPRPAAPDPRLPGVFPAVVTDVRDPLGLGRVQVRSNVMPAAWARVATLSAGPKSGSWFIPDVADEVLVAFEAGDAQQPYVLGGLWNPQNPPPAAMDPAGANSRKILRSRRGVTVTLDDQTGQESVTIATPGGQRIVLTDGPASVRIVDANGNSVDLAATGITIAAATKVTINASEVDVSAGLVQCNAGMAKFSGVVQCSTLVANSVVSASYTPGAGNVM